VSEGILTREQLEERLATLHQASLELVKDISLETLLERIAQLACEHVDAQYAAVGVLDAEGHLEKFIPVGMSPEEIERMDHPPLGLGLIGMLMDTMESVRIANILEDTRSAGFPPHHPKMTSFLGVPLRLGDRQVGQIYLTNKTTAPEFSADDERVIEMLASYAAVAISNAQYYAQIIERDRVLMRRNENLGLVNEMASVLTSSDNIDQVLSNVLSRVLEHSHLDVGEFYLRKEDGRILQLVLHQGNVVPQLMAQTEFQLGEGLIGITAQTGQPSQVDLRFWRERNSSGDWRFHEDTLQSCLQQVACIPLSGSRGVLGTLCVASCSLQPLDELEMQFLSSISLWAGMAIENLRLNVQQRRLAVLEERERIGMDLHDGIIQDIYAVGLTLEHARLLLSENTQASRQRIEQAIDDLNNTIRDIRSYILDLRPRKLHEENLVDGLRRLIAEFRANTLIETTLQAPGKSLNLSQSQAIALFHICQEALANIGKHSFAHHVTISLWTTADRVLLEIGDDGYGFDLTTTKLTLGHGLSNMQTRARNAGGELEISTEPGKGTTILVWVPNTNES